MGRVNAAPAEAMAEELAKTMRDGDALLERRRRQRGAPAVRGELMEMADAATKVSDALPLVAALLWLKHGGAFAVPTEAELAAWLLACPKDAIEASRRRLADIDRKRHKPAHERPIHPSTHTLAQAAGIDADVQNVAMVVERGAEVPPGKATWGNDAQWRWLPELANADTDEKRTWGSLPLLVPVVLRGSAISAPDILWLRWAPDAWRALTPLVRAWQRAQPSRIAPFALVRRASMPRFHRVSDDEAQHALAIPLPDAREPDQLTLPGPPDAIAGYPSWLLNTFEALVGDIKGRRAPMELRLFVAALLRVARADRDGQWHMMAFPVLDKHRERWRAPESIESLLFDNGWTNFNRDGDGLPRLLKAIEAINRSPAAWLAKPEISTAFEFFRVTGAPTAEDGLVEFSIRIPASAANGDRLDWPSLRRYGTTSRALYCAYLSASALLGETAHRGHPQTAEIRKPLLGKDGKPLRDKAGRVRRGRELVANDRAQRLVRPYSAADLARFCAMDVTRKQDRNRAVGHFETLAQDGHIDLRKEGGQWRIFGRHGDE